MTLLKSSLAHMAFAFVAMGGWATYANIAYPLPRPIFAGFVQGCLSAVITLLLKRMIEILTARLSGVPALVLPPIVAMLGSFLLLVTMHRAAGTPEIARTIAVPVTVTSLYSAIYTYSLRGRKNA